MGICKRLCRLFVPLSFCMMFLCLSSVYSDDFDEERFIGSINRELQSREQFGSGAAGTDQQELSQGVQFGNDTPYALVILRIIGYLAIIIALIFGVAWFIKKTGLAGASKIGGGASMDILEVVGFGQNRNAMLIRVMDCVYLLGQTPGSIVLLDKIEGQNAIDIIASSKEGTSIVQFKDAFNSFMGKIKKSP